MDLDVPCPLCGKFPPPCDCPPLPPGPPDPPSQPVEELKPRARKEVVKLRREKRRGRAVIVVEGLPSDVNRAEYARALKEKCATGGTVKGQAIEIQGERIRRLFRTHNLYRVAQHRSRLERSRLRCAGANHDVPRRCRQ